MMKKSQMTLLSEHPELFAECERCASKVEKAKCNSVSSKGKTLEFCDSCFSSVFKFDKRLRTISRIWAENGKKFPFTVRKSSWHPSTYLVIKNAESMMETEDGKTKAFFFGDLFLHGELKDQNKAVTSANLIVWLSWSKEEAEKEKWAGSEVANAEETP